MYNSNHCEEECGHELGIVSSWLNVFPTDSVNSVKETRQVCIECHHLPTENNFNHLRGRIFEDEQQT